MTACVCDYDPAEFYTATTPTARKPHRCDECRQPIAVGERYERVAAKWEGTVDTMRTCSRCLALREYVNAHVPCFCWEHHNMLDDAKDTIEHFAHECPGLFMGYGRLLVAVLGSAKRRARTQGGDRG